MKKYSILLEIILSTLSWSCTASPPPNWSSEELPQGQGSPILGPESQSFELWRKPPITSHLKVYFFNVTNHKDFLEKGAKLHVREIGPYTYSAKWERIDQVWNPNGTLSYRTVKNFTFVPEESFGLESDLLLLPNIPMLTAIARVEHSSRIVQKSVDTVLDVLKSEPFVVHSVQEFLWGYDDPLVKMAQGVIRSNKRYPYEQFGFLVGKNNTPSEVYTVSTVRGGLTDFSIQVYGGKNSLGVWGTDQCNEIKGSDGTAFPSILHENSSVFIFLPDFCRPIELVVKNIQGQKHDGSETLRFQPTNHVFGSVEEYPENKCYCQNAKCSPRGVFNVSLCYFNSPIFLSWPHFLNADPNLFQNIVGLNPKQELHFFYIDIAPKQGLAVQAKERIQVNVQMTKIDGIPQTENFSNLLIPVVWFEKVSNQI